MAMAIQNGLWLCTAINQCVDHDFIGPGSQVRWGMPPAGSVKTWVLETRKKLEAFEALTGEQKT